MKKSIYPGMFGGSIFNKEASTDLDGIQYGPITQKQEEDPGGKLIKKTSGGNSFYEPNGLTYANEDIFPIKYLKS